MKKRYAIPALMAAGLILSGCATQVGDKITNGQVTSRVVDLEDGRSVTCVFWVPVDNSGVAVTEGAQLSCDWATVFPLEDE